jgi:PAS domain S-box-containing protein
MEPHQSAEALLDSQTRLSAALAVAKLGTFEWDLRTDAVALDERSREIFGFTPNEATRAQDVFNRIDPPGFSRVYAEAQASIQSKSRLEIEYRVVRPDGTIRNVLSISDVVVGNGQTERVLGVFCDVTEQKTSQANLQQIQDRTDRQERLYETILSNTPDLMYVFDLDHRFIYANKVLLQMWGKSWNEAIGKNCLELGYEPWHAAMHDREIEQVKSTKQPIRGEVPFDGTFGRRIYDYIFVPIIGADGEVEAVAGTTRDVTERKTAELHAAFMAEVGRDLMHVSTPQEIVKTVGEHLQRAFGITQCAFVEIDAQAALATVDYEWHQNDIRSLVGVYNLVEFVSEEFLRTALAGEPVVITDADSDARVVDPSSWQALNIRAHVLVPLIRAGQWKFALCVYHREVYSWRTEDVELLQLLAARIWARLERAFAEREREAVLEREKAARVQAEEANRLKDEFLATVSHELRTPLNAILGWSQLMMSKALDEEMSSRAAETVYRNAKAQAQLIEDILDVSRVIAGKVRLETKPILLAPIIQNVVDSLRPSIDAKAIDLRVESGHESRPTYADPDRLQQVLWNLLSNAVKFTPEHGQITVRRPNRRNTNSPAGCR